MKLCILQFLQKLSSEGKILPRLREMVRDEKDKYEGMRQVLSGAEKNKEMVQGLLAEIDAYLLDLIILEKKFNFPYLALLKTSPAEKPELNQQVLEILRKVNAK
ncbi:hypothetical protein [Adhaeribacter soli]|uniref:Uncharacterized protein n=1 Tax=Adhaeribacter soli TaxID=2607655 RepID=A0A5N1J9Y3_9BACT|nr:hypothetical protein [Adhaeribacter soli]KAA9346125.1 hypothetical protein F0P94_03315 [Adhaeribacter soli]